MPCSRFFLHFHDCWSVNAAALIMWQTASYNTIADLQSHNTYLGIIALFPRWFSHFRSSIHQACLSFPIAPWSWNESPATATILQVSYYPSSPSSADASLWTKGPSIHPTSTPPCSSRSIHGSFLPFNGLDSCVSVIANLIFPSLKAWSMLSLGNARQTWKRQN